MQLARVTLSFEGSVVDAQVSGDVDLSNVGILQTQIMAAVPNEATALIVDFSDVAYLDSAGIHFVHRLREELRARGQLLLLVVPPESVVHDTLRLAGVRWEEQIADTPAQARQWLPPRPRSEAEREPADPAQPLGHPQEP